MAMQPFYLAKSDYQKIRKPKNQKGLNLNQKVDLSTKPEKTLKIVL